MIEENNIINICPNCSQKQLEVFQKQWSLIQQLYEKGRKFFIKAAFETYIEKIPREHIWVKVDHIDFEAKKIYGIIFNNPIYTSYLYHSMPVEVEFERCSQLYLGEAHE